MNDIEIKEEILNFVPVEGNNITDIQIKIEEEDPLHPFNEGYYFIQCKCSVLVKRSDKSVQCNLYEGEMDENKISNRTIEQEISKPIENNNVMKGSPRDMIIEEKANKTLVILEESNINDPVDNLVMYDSVSNSSSEDEGNFENFYAKDGVDISKKLYTRVETGYKCSKCDKVSVKLAHFGRHYVSHLEHSRLCYACGTTIKDNLFNHMLQCKWLKNDIPRTPRRQTPIRYVRKKCLDCGTLIKSALDENDHNNIHNNLKPYLCSCGSTCRFFSNFITHLKKFKCPIDKCILPEYAPQDIKPWIDRETQKRDSVSFRMRRDNINAKQPQKVNETIQRRRKLLLPKSELICRECGIDTFANYVKYRNHMETKHLERKYECKEKRCKKKFSTARSMRFHVKNNHIIQYKCEKCNIVFSLSKFKFHMTKNCQGLDNVQVTVSNYKTTFRNRLFYCVICAENEEYQNIKIHFMEKFHVELEEKWKEKYKIKDYKCCNCKKLNKKTKIYNFFFHLEKAHKYCYITQINEMFKSFENGEVFFFNDKTENE